MESTLRAMNLLETMSLLSRTVEKLIEEGVEGDLYTKGVARAFDMEESDVTPEQRQLCKEASFSTRYGAGPKEIKEAVLSKFQDVDYAEIELRLAATFPAMEKMLKDGVTVDPEYVKKLKEKT